MPKTPAIVIITIIMMVAIVTLLVVFFSGASFPLVALKVLSKPN